MLFPLPYRFSPSITLEPFSKIHKLTRLVDVRKTVSYFMGRNQPSGRCNALFIIFWRSSRGQVILASRWLRYMLGFVGWPRSLYLEACGVMQGSCIRNLKSREGFIALQITAGRQDQIALHWLLETPSGLRESALQALHKGKSFAVLLVGNYSFRSFSHNFGICTIRE